LSVDARIEEYEERIEEGLRITDSLATLASRREETINTLVKKNLALACILILSSFFVGEVILYRHVLTTPMFIALFIFSLSFFVTALCYVYRSVVESKDLAKKWAKEHKEIKERIKMLK